MTRKRCLLRQAVLVLLFASAAAGIASGEAPDYEFLPVPSSPVDVSRPAPKFRYMFGPSARWAGSLRWKYNHANAPPWLAGDPAGAVGMIRAALDTWTGSCGITHVYEGPTSTPPNRRIATPQGEIPDEENVVGWGSLEGNTLGVTYVWYTYLPGGSLLNDGDIIFSPGMVTSSATLRATAAHEWGHALGLAHSNIGGMTMSGPPETGYTHLTSPQGDDIRGCRCLYGPRAGESVGYACSLQDAIQFGSIPLGAASSPYLVTLTNNGNGPLAVNGVVLSSPRLSTDQGCAAGSVLSPGQSCVIGVTVRPDSAWTFIEQITLETSDGPYPIKILFEGTNVGSVTPTVQIVEYHHAGFGHYFVTHLADEIGKLDDGTFAGWTRTGRMFNGWKEPPAVSAPVCRFFSASFAPKSSHFYTSFASECQKVKSDSKWTFEGEVFHVALPDAQGNCVTGTQPVFRLYNNGSSGAPNHRFTVDAGVRQQMISEGWLPEGSGPGVTMCAPL